MGDESRMLDSIWDRAPDVVSARSGDATILFDLRSGEAFELDSIGAKVWQSAGSRPLREVLAEMMDEYDVEAETMRVDLLRIVSELCASGLLAMRGA